MSGRNEKKETREECEILRKALDAQKEENERLRKEVMELKTRQSERASVKMRQNNPCVEDLSDPFRPTAIRDKWDDFFNNGQYWTAFSKMKTKKKSEDDIIRTLHSVCQLVYTTCSDYVSRELQKATEHVTQAEPLSESTPRQKQTKASGGDRGLAPRTRQQILLSLNNGNHLEDLQEQCRQSLPSADLEMGHLTSFVRDLVDICFHMQMQEIPLVVDFSSEPGTPFNGSLYKTEDDSKPPGPNAVIKLVMQPPLLRGVGGPVLSKGLVVVGESSEDAKNKTNTSQEARPKLPSQEPAHTESGGNVNSASSIPPGKTEGHSSNSSAKRPGTSVDSSAKKPGISVDSSAKVPGTSVDSSAKGPGTSVDKATQTDSNPPAIPSEAMGQAKMTPTPTRTEAIHLSRSPQPKTNPSHAKHGAEADPTPAGSQALPPRHREETRSLSRQGTAANESSLKQ